VLHYHEFYNQVSNSEAAFQKNHRSCCRSATWQSIAEHWCKRHAPTLVLGCVHQIGVSRFSLRSVWQQHEERLDRKFYCPAARPCGCARRRRVKNRKMSRLGDCHSPPALYTAGKTGRDPIQVSQGVGFSSSPCLHWAHEFDRGKAWARIGSLCVCLFLFVLLRLNSATKIIDSPLASPAADRQLVRHRW